MLAAKAALAARVDALGEDSTVALGTEHRAYLEQRLKFLEEGGQRRISAGQRKSFKPEKYENKSEIRQYPVAADVVIKKVKKEEEISQEIGDTEGL
jgi:nucleolar protein 58